jgi:LysR family hydrogen peroxide-inducible transcriptional activator
MVAEGLGITLLPRMAVPVETAGSNDVVVRPVSPGGPARSIALVWRGTSTRGDDFAKLGAVLGQTAETAIAKGRAVRK